MLIGLVVLWALAAEANYVLDHLNVAASDLNGLIMERDMFTQQHFKKGTLIAWTEYADDPKQKRIHIRELQPTNMGFVKDIVLDQKGWILGFHAREDGGFVVVRASAVAISGQPDENMVYVERYNDNGVRVAPGFRLLWTEDDPSYHKGRSYTGFGGLSLKYHPKGNTQTDKGLYVVYSKLRQLRPDSQGLRHQMDFFTLLDDDMQMVKQTGQLCSHSLQLDVSWHPDASQGYLAVCLGDAFPKAITVRGNMKTGSWSYKVPGNGAGRSRGSISNLLAYDDHWILAFGACRTQVSDPYPHTCQTELGMVRLWFEGDHLSSSAVTWMTNTPNQDEMDITMERYDGVDILVAFVSVNGDGVRQYRMGVMSHEFEWKSAPEDVGDKVKWFNVGNSGKSLHMQRLSTGDVLLPAAWDISSFNWASNKVSTMQLAVIEKPDETCPAAINNCYDKASCGYLWGQKWCKCPAGFLDKKGDGTECEDVRCSNGQEHCGTNALCTDEPSGGFTCACPTGWVGNPEKGGQCVWVERPLTDGVITDTLLFYHESYWTRGKDLFEDCGGQGQLELTKSNGETVCDHAFSRHAGTGGNLNSGPQRSEWHTLAVMSPSAQSVKMTFQAVGYFHYGVELWMNGVKVFSKETTDRKGNTDTFDATGVPLNRGWNRVLMRYWTSNNGKFTARFDSNNLGWDYVPGGDPWASPHALDCIMSSWSEWGTCSKQCNGGTQVSTRFVLHEPAHGGKACPTNRRNERGCNAFACAEDPPAPAGSVPVVYPEKDPETLPLLEADGVLRWSELFTSDSYWTQGKDQFAGCGTEAKIDLAPTTPEFCTHTFKRRDAESNGNIAQNTGDGHSEWHWMVVHSPATQWVDIEFEAHGWFHFGVQLYIDETMEFEKKGKTGGGRDISVAHIQLAKGYHRMLIKYWCSNAAFLKVTVKDEAGKKLRVTDQMYREPGKSGAANDKGAETGSEGGNTVAIALGVVGAVVGVAILAVVVLLVIRKRGGTPRPVPAVQQYIDMEGDKIEETL